MVKGSEWCLFEGCHWLLISLSLNDRIEAVLDLFAGLVLIGQMERALDLFVDLLLVGWVEAVLGIN